EAERLAAFAAVLIPAAVRAWAAEAGGVGAPEQTTRFPALVEEVGVWVRRLRELGVEGELRHACESYPLRRPLPLPHRGTDSLPGRAARSLRRGRSGGSARRVPGRGCETAGGGGRRCRAARRSGLGGHAGIGSGHGGRGGSRRRSVRP